MCKSSVVLVHNHQQNNIVICLHQKCFKAEPANCIGSGEGSLAQLNGKCHHQRNENNNKLDILP